MSSDVAVNPTAPSKSVNENAARAAGAPPPPRRLPSIRLLITLIVVIPMTIVSAALIAITTLTSNQIAEQLGREIVTNTTSQVSSDVREYLGSDNRAKLLYIPRAQDDTASEEAEVEAVAS